MNSTLPNKSRLVKIGEAAKLLGVSHDTLRRWGKAGKIETVRTPGGTRLYPVKALKNFSKPQIQNPNQESYSKQSPHHTEVSQGMSKDLLQTSSLSALSSSQQADEVFSSKNIPSFSSTESPLNTLANQPIPTAHIVNPLVTKFILVSSVITVLLTGMITAGYFTAPQQTKSFLSAVRKTQEGEVLGASFPESLKAESRRLMTAILSPFNQLSQKVIQTTNPEKAKELGFADASSIKSEIAILENSNKELKSLTKSLKDSITSLQNDNNSQFLSLSSQLGSPRTTTFNLMANSSFEANTSGQPNSWYYLNQSTSNNTFVNNASVRSGNMAVRIQPTGISGTDTSTSFGIYQPSINTAANHVYTLSLYIRNQLNTTATLRLSYWDRANNRTALSSDFVIENIDDWKRYSFSIDPPNQYVNGNGYYPMIEILNVSSGSTGNIFLDDIDFSEGHTTSTYDQENLTIGDGSIAINSNANFYPVVSRTGSLGLANFTFSSLYLTKASVDVNGTASFAGDGTFDGNLNIGGNSTLSGDVAINGGDITSTSTSFNLLNSTVSSLNLGGAATSIAIGAATGTTTINNNLIVTGTTTSSSNFSLPDGSASTPALNFTNNTNAGLYRLGSNSIGLITNGSATSGITINNGDIGIGTTTPGYKLDITGTLNASGATTLGSTLGVTGLATFTAGFDANSSSTATALTLDGNSGTALTISGTSFTTDISLQNGETIDNNTDGTITLTSTDLTLSGTTSITASSLTTLTSSASLTLAGASTVATDQSSLNLFNTTATTLNFGGAATTISIGAVTGTTTINNATTALTGNLTVAGTTGATLSGNGAGLTFSGTGNHDITASAGTLRLGAVTATGALSASTGGLDIGSAGTRFGIIYADEVNATTLVGTLTGGNLTADTFTINSDNSTADTEDSNIAFERGSVTPNALITWDSTNKEFDLNSSINLTGTTSLTTQPLLTLSTATAHTTGDIFDITATYTPTAGGTQSAFDLNITNSPSTNANTLRVIDIGLTDAGILANTVYGLYVDVTTANANDTTYAATFLNGNVGIGDTSPTNALTVTGATSISSYLQIGQETTTTYSRFGAGVTGHTLSGADALLITGAFEVDGAGYFDSTLDVASTLTANTFASSGATLTGGTINNMIIGGSTPAAGTFTALVGTTVNGNTITTGTGVLTLGASKTLTVSDTTTLATDSITFAGTEVLTLAATKSVTFADAFATSGAFSTTLTATGTTNVTLPTTGTLSTLAGVESLSNKTLVSPVITTSPTAAGATWTDLGIVTTADINGGTIDGTTIGGSTAAAGTFTDLTVNGNTILGDNIADTLTIYPTTLAFLKENAHTIQIADSTTADTAGAALTIKGAAGAATNAAGGAINLTAGAGAGTSTGGAINITTGGSGSGTSGGFSLVTGQNDGVGKGGAILIRSGHATNSAAGLGGAITLQIGASNTGTTPPALALIGGRQNAGGSVTGGAVTITGGDVNTSGTGGAVTITSGTGSTDSGGGAGATSGAVTLRSGAGQTHTTGNGGASGALTLSTGNGGAVTTSTGTGGAAGTLSITGGNGGGTNAVTGGAGSAISITAGNGGAGSTTGGAAGNLTLTAGNAGSGGNINGGTLTLNSGTVTGSGTSTINFGTSNATLINIGDSTVTKTIDLGGVDSSAADTINIATEGTAADVITIGNAHASTTLALTGGDDWSITSGGVSTFSSITDGTATLTGGDLSGLASLTIAGVEGSTVFTVTAGDADISDGSLAITDDDNASSFSVTNNTITTANLVAISSSSLSSGSLLDLTTTSTAAASNTQKGLNIALSGANATTTQTTYGGYISNTHTGTSSTNVGLYATASGGSNNYAAIFEAGNVGIGDTTPAALLTVGNADLFQVASTGATSITPTADVVPLTLTKGGNTNVFSIVKNSGGAGNAINVSASTVDTGVSITLNDPGAGDRNAIIDGISVSNTTSRLGIVGANDYSYAGGRFTMTHNGAPTTAHDVYGVYGSATANDNNFTAYGGYFTASSSSGTAFGIYSAAGNNYFAGSVGIGDTSPDAKLEVLSTTEQLRLTYTDGTVDSRFTVDSSGNLTIDNTGTLTTIADGLTVTGTLTTNGAIAANTDVDLTLAGNENMTITNTTNTLGGAGMLDLASTSSTTDTRTLDLSTIFTATGATTSYGLYNTWASSAVVTGAGVSQTGYGLYNTATKTGLDDATGTYTLYGTYSTASNTGSTDAGTKNTYGGYFTATGDTAGTSNAIGLYASASGADNNYAAIFEAGNVGIGTTTPSSKLDITTNSLGVTPNNTSGLALINTTAAAAGAQQISPALRWRGSGWKTDATAASQTIDFRSYVVPVQGSTAPSGYLVFDRAIEGVNGGAYSGLVYFTTNGDVGIGIASPDAKLHLSGSSPTASGIRFTDTSASPSHSWQVSPGITSVTNEGFSIYDVTNSITRVYIDNSGNLGIGSTAPDARLEINHATGDNLRLTYNDADGSATNYTDFSLSSAGALTLTGSAATLAASATAEKTFLTLTPGTITLTAPTQVTSLMETAVLTGATIAADLATTVDKATTLSLVAPIDSTNTTLTDASSLRILNVTSGAGTLTNQYGIHIEALTAGASDYGIYVADADTASLWLGSDDGDAASGITFGATKDTNLYRSAANTLTTDDALTITGTLTTNGAIAANTDVDLTLAGNENMTITNTTNTLGGAGMLDLASTSSTTDTRTLDLSTTFTATGATTSYGLYNTWASSAVVTGAAVSQTAYGNYNTATKTGADDATGTYTLYGSYSTASNTGSTDAGTKNTYGGYFTATGDTAGTSNAIGLYASATGADTNYGLQVAAGQSIFSAAGATSAPSILADGTWFTGGSATTTKPQLLIEPAGTTSTGWSTSGTGLGINAASGFTGKLLDLQLAGSRKFSIASDGQTAFVEAVTGPAFTASSFVNTNSLTHYGALTIQALTNGGATISSNAFATGLTTLTVTHGADTSVVAEKSTFVLTAHTQTITGGFATFRDSVFNQPTITAASALDISTQATTMTIAGAPISAGSATIANAYALKIDTGTSVASGVTNAYGLYVDAPTGATNNYAATFATGNVGIGDTSPSSLLEVGDGTDSIQFGSTGDITFVDADGAASITGPAGGALSITGGSGQALNLDSGTTGAVNIGTGANAKTVTIGNATDATALAFNSGTGSQTFTSQVVSGTTTTSGFVFDATALTTGTGSYFTSDAITTGKLAQFATTGNTLTTGTLVDIRSTATSLTGTAGTGSFINLDWSPGSATTATGDLFALNIGTNGTTTGNLFNILDTGSSIFSISETAMTTSLPTNFTSSGDVSIAYDINFTNPTASYIKSIAPINIVAGETFNSSNLTLQTYNQGTVVVDTATTTGTSMNILSNSLTTGTGLLINANALTTGTATSITSTSTAGGASGSSYLVNLSRSGANANATHTAYGISSTVANTGTTSVNVGGYFAATGATTNRGLEVAAMTGATSTGLTIGALSGATANTGLSVGAITSAATANNFGLNIGAITSQASATSYAINTGAISGAGTATYGINLGANSSTATTNYGINIGAVSGAGTTNYGLNIGAVSGASSNYGIALAAAATQTLWISSDADNTAAAAGIAFGSSRDTNLYRSAANTLKTDDALSVEGALSVNGTISDPAGNLTIASATNFSANLGVTILGGTGRLSFSDYQPNGTTGALQITNTTTHAVDDAKLINLSHTGVVTGSNKTIYGLYSSVSSTGSLENIAGYFTASGATTNYGIHVAAGKARLDTVTLLQPSATQTLAAGTAITADATHIKVAGSGGAVTLTAAPTIANGVEGDTIIIRGTDNTNTLTIQDQGTLASSNLQLGATTRELGNGDTISLMFDGTDWVELWYNGSIDAADYAEMYKVREDVQRGDIVALDETESLRVRKAVKGDTGKLVGIISTDPAYLIGDEFKDQIALPVALAGRVPTKVSAENGAIEVGDYLTASSIPGVAMKATQPGPVIGQALEVFSGDGVSKILAFVNVTYADPGNFFASLTIDDAGDLIMPKIKTANLIINTDINLARSDDKGLLAYTTVTDLSNQESYDVDVLSSLKNLEDAVITAQDNQTLASGNIIQIEDKIATQSSALADLQSQIASLSGVIASATKQSSSSAEIAASSSTPRNDVEELNLTPPDALISTGSATLADLKVTSLATFSGMLAAYDLNVSNTFKSFGESSLGNTTIAGDLTVDGTFTITNGNTINSLGTLFLQNSALSTQVDLFAGKVLIDNTGKLTAQTIAAKEYLGASGSTVGTGKIATGTKTVTINSTLVKANSRILVTPTSETSQTLSVVAKNANTSFTVSVPFTTATDINFDWFIVNEYQ